MGGARICPRRHCPGAIFPRQGRTGRVQPGRRLQTTRCRPSRRRARLRETSPLQQQSTTRWSVQGSFLSHHPTLPRLCSRWPRASRWSDVRGNINSLAAGVTADGSAPFAAVPSWSTATATNNFTTQPTVLHVPGVASTPTRGSRIYCGLPYHVFGNRSSTTSTISWTSSAGSTLTALMTSWMSPAGQHHTDLGGNTLRPAPSTRQLRGDTRRFAISTRSSYLGSSMSGKKTAPSVPTKSDRTCYPLSGLSSIVPTDGHILPHNNFTTKQPTTSVRKQSLASPPNTWGRDQHAAQLQYPAWYSVRGC